MTFDPEKFQGEVCAWSSRNFPKGEPWMPLMGLTEEVGELIEAIENYSNITMFERAPDRIAEIKDALGDCMVYLADYCWRSGFELVSCARRQSGAFDKVKWSGDKEGAQLIELFKTVCKMSHHHLKNHQGIRMNERHKDQLQICIGKIVQLLKMNGAGMGLDLTECVEATWSRVKQRDWIKNKENGAVPAPSPKFKAKPTQMKDLAPGKDIWDTL